MSSTTTSDHTARLTGRTVPASGPGTATDAVPLAPDPTRVADAYRMVVMQPTTFCNLDCRYCYLALRGERLEMPPGVAAAVAADIAVQDDSAQVTVLWHGGEPTALSPARFRQLLEPFEELRSTGRVRHSVQTNATLITDEWCELFRTYGFSVGVSLDGPPDTTTERVNRAGRPAHQQIMAGVRRLQAAGLALSVIAVITPETVHRGTEIIEFLHGAGFDRIGFNLEEREGVNEDRPMVGQAAARRFWREIITYCRQTATPPKIRELGTLSRYLDGGNVPVRDVLPTVTHNGDIVLLSPELTNLTVPEHDDFVVGNILTTPIQDILTRHHTIPYVAAFERGLTACKANCPFWSLCYGGYASNRFCETGRFDVTETAHCRGSRQAVVHAALDVADPDADRDLVAVLSPHTHRPGDAA
ncbi:cyclophane-forming radical SAM peptide maturase AmcB [Streptomyces sp. NPDC059373]